MPRLPGRAAGAAPAEYGGVAAVARITAARRTVASSGGSPGANGNSGGARAVHHVSARPPPAAFAVPESPFVTGGSTPSPANGRTLGGGTEMPARITSLVRTGAILGVAGLALANAGCLNQD